MPIDYRLMDPKEIEQIMDLWLEVYPGTERESWKKEFLSIPGSLEHTYVAVDSGRVLSTALLWIREMNDAAGRLRRVGNVSHVATHPAARRRGLAKQLLGLVIEQMEQENCDFSTLFTSDEGRPLYERCLWETSPTYFWQGRLTSDLPQSTEYSTRALDEIEEPYLWNTLSEIYTDFNKARPFAFHRDLSTWKSFTAYKITDWVQAGASVLLAYPTRFPERICGYLIAHCTDQGFLIGEFGVKEGDRVAIPNLLNHIFRSYERGQQVMGRLYVPDEPDIITLLQRCLDPFEQIKSTELMIRAVNQQKNLDPFIIPRSQQAAMIWILDQT